LVRRENQEYVGRYLIAGDGSSSGSIYHGGDAILSVWRWAQKGEENGYFGPPLFTGVPANTPGWKMRRT